MASTRELRELAKWLRNHIEPVSSFETKDTYRAAAHLTDGTFLPCVVFSNPAERLKLALRRFEETRKDRSLDPSINYEAIVKAFAIDGSRVSAWQIARIDHSRFAIPAKLRDVVFAAGETRMSWIQFVGTMADGSSHSFGSPFNIEFFDMPEGYSAKDMVEVVSHTQTDGRRYNDLPFFDCFLDDL